MQKVKNSQIPVWSSQPMKKLEYRTSRILPADSSRITLTSKDLPNAPNLPCIVCYQNLAEGIYTNCDHQIICLQCAETHFMSCLQTGEEPRCLVSACKAPFILRKDSIFYKFNTDLKRKWSSSEQTKMMKRNSLPDAIFRPCQYPNCDGQVNPLTRQCTVCEQLHCKDCFRLSHSGACRSVSLIMSDGEFKICKFCKGRIYKEGGCAKIICSTCKKTVCYECGQAWSYRHHGCASGGWLKLPYYFFLERCCTDDHVSKSSEIIL